MTLTLLWLVAIVLLVIGFFSGDHSSDFRAMVTGRPSTAGDWSWLIGAYLFAFAFVLTTTKWVLFP